MELDEITKNGDFSGIEKVISLMTNSEKHYDIEKIQRAYLYANSLHEGLY